MKPYWKITAWYLLFGALWIFFSDHLLKRIAPDIETLSFFQTIKGWLYIAASGVLVFQLIKHNYQARESKEREKMEIFKSTLKGSHHILFNYLNQMQLVIIEAERCKDFDQSVIGLSKDITDEATSALVNLSQLEEITSENIDSAVYGEARRG